MIYNNIGKLLVKAERVGEIPGIVEKYRAEIEKIETIGLENFDDMGMGYRAEDFGTVSSPEKNRRQQLRMLQSLKGTDTRLLKEYYAQVGDDEKEAEESARLTAQHAERTGTEQSSSFFREGTPEEPTSSFVTSHNSKDIQYKATYDRLMKVDVPADPFDKLVRQAIVYTNQHDQRAVAAWDAVNEEAQRIDNEGTWDGVGARGKLDNLRAVIWNESLRAYRTLGTTEKSIEFVKKYIEKRESSRATIASESHKRSFQELGLEIYDSYIMMTAALPEENLAGMERAKSRAMLDLMSGGIDRIDNAKVREIHRLQAMKTTEGESSERGFVIQGKLRELRQEHPEYYTLISSEIGDRDDLVSALEPDMIALSYYMTDDTLFINAFGSEEQTFFTSSSKMTEKVVSVPISTPEIVSAVQQFRHGLASPVQAEKPVGGRIYMEYPLRDDGEELVIVNDSPLELKVQEIWASLDMSPNKVQPETSKERDQYQMSSLADTVAPGERAVVMRFLYNRPVNQSQVSESHVNIVIGHRIKTNLGELVHKKRVRAEPGEKASVTTESRKDIVISDTHLSLYDLLIKPVEEIIKGKRLVIVPHGILHSIPFEALKDGQGRYLVEKHVVSYAPSLNVLKLSRDKKRSEPTRLVAFGDTLGDLEFARREVDAIKGEFSDSVVMLGDQVTLESVKRAMGQGDVVHFACHGIFNGSAPMDSGLVMATPSGRKVESENDLELLKVTDIMSMKINPDLVFLSACDTGRAVIGSGDEIVGLTRGFFVAGTPSVINTLWAIDDQSTAMLAQRFYRNMFAGEMDKARALQEAKLYLMENGFESPYYWGAFVLQGDWQ
ncbi:MAG: CHAT domain-containing protein [Pseudodesulfovibrio sp.]